jgi:hypothetical protein
MLTALTVRALSSGGLTVNCLARARVVEVAILRDTSSI